MKKIILLITATAVLSALHSEEGDTTKSEKPQSIVYYASVKSEIYHHASCEWAQKIKSENRVIFKTREDAKAAKYKPCSVCKPELDRAP